MNHHLLICLRSWQRIGCRENLFFSDIGINDIMHRTVRHDRHRCICVGKYAVFKIDHPFVDSFRSIWHNLLIKIADSATILKWPCIKCMGRNGERQKQRMHVGVAETQKLTTCRFCLLHRSDSVAKQPPLLSLSHRGKSHIYCPNVQSHLPPLASGTKGCFAADVPEVPKARWLGGLLCSDISSEFKLVSAFTVSRFFSFPAAVFLTPGTPSV